MALRRCRAGTFHAALDRLLPDNSANYIVLLGFTIFPSFRAETLPGQIYLVCAVVLGGLAALSVWRNE